MKNKIDRFLSSWISKKLFVLLIGTVLAFIGKLSGEQFVNLSMVYIGSQAAIDAITKLRNFKQHID
jgi:hypothetical protein